MKDFLNKISNELQVEQFIEIDPATHFCKRYDPVSMKGHILAVIKKVLEEVK